jgi:hypothetical protein
LSQKGDGAHLRSLCSSPDERPFRDLALLSSAGPFLCPLSLTDHDISAAGSAKLGLSPPMALYLQLKAFDQPSSLIDGLIPAILPKPWREKGA